jgi:peroxiredoxin (alkyl hydroperoxide reductase subunit C)
MQQIGQKAINFTAPAIMPDNSINENFDFHKYIDGKLSVLFFYPLDFTFVCPSEIIALNTKLDEFKQRNTNVVTVSVDSHFSHLAYKKTPISSGGIGDIAIPMISDITKDISRNYGVLSNESVAFRGVFVFDQNKILRHKLVNDLPIGRSIDEIIRIVDAIIFNSEYGEVCPANWSKGNDGMIATQDGVASYLSRKYSE